MSLASLLNVRCRLTPFLIAIQYIRHNNSTLTGSEYGEDDISESSYKSSIASATSSAISVSESDLASEIQLEPLSTLDELIYSIEEAVSRLFRFSNHVRRPSRQSQDQKADKFVPKDEFGNEVLPAFEDFALQILKFRFPEANSSFLEMLSRSITKRRQRFLFRQRHQQKLSQGTEEYSANRPLPEIQSTFQHDGQTVKKIEPTQIGNHTLVPELRVKKAMSSTIASEPQARIRPESIYAPSTRQSTAIYAYASNIRVPPPPKMLPGCREFQCPYCCMMLPAKDAVPGKWRKVHVYSSKV
jgi:hypothetical protein